MRNLTLNAFQADVIAADRRPTLHLYGEVLLPSGCQLARQADGTYLLKGYAADGSDLAASIATSAWSDKVPKPDMTHGLIILPTWLYHGELFCAACMGDLPDTLGEPVDEENLWPLTPEETVAFTEYRNTCSGCDTRLVALAPTCDACGKILTEQVLVGTSLLLCAECSDAR